MTKPLRILFIAWRDTSHPLAGGSELMVDRLAQGLHERGHEVTLLAGAPMADHDYAVVEGSGTYSQYLTSPLRYLRDHRDADVVVDLANGMSFYTPLVRSAPTVCFVHHIHYGQWREWFGPAVAKFGATMETQVMPRVYRNSLFVTVSPSSMSSLEGLGVPRENIRIVANGVDPVLDEVARSDDPLFVAIGRLVPHKRFDLMLRAWRRVQPVTGGRLLVAGDGPCRADLERLAGPGVDLLGWITDEEKQRLLGRAWFIVQPSRLEGWGLVVMEAAARSTPAIGFWSPGTRDAVVDGETGLLVESENQLVEQWISLAGDVERREKLGEAARRRAGEFSWDSSVEQFERVLYEAVGGGPRRVWSPRRPAAVCGPAVLEDPATDPVLHERSRYTKRALFRLFLSEKTAPEPFYTRLAEKSIAEFPYALAGRRVLDLGSGPGHYTDVLRKFGADVAAVELDAANLASSSGPLRGGVSADGRTLPFADGTFDGVFCSNMLEHTPDPAPIFGEIARVLAPGGWAWISWTNWYSPWGGHDITPLHYLGPTYGLRAWRRFFGEPRKNAPFDGLWPTHIGPTIALARSVPGLDLDDAVPRYYPSQRWITRVPGLREFVTWNCVLTLTRNDADINEERDDPSANFETGSARAVARRSLRRARRIIGDDPIFLPIVLRATPIGTSRAITDDTELVIEGFPRSGNTFAYFAFLHAMPDAVVTSRVHTPSQVMSAVRRGVPTLQVVRPPRDVVASLLIAAPHVPIKSALEEYIHHHEQILPLVDNVVVASFDDVTTDFGLVIDELNRRFGTDFDRFDHTPANVDEVFAVIEAHHAEHWGDTENVVPRPSSARRDEKDWLLRQLGSAEYAGLVQEAQTVYAALAARAVGSTPATP